MTTPEPGPGRGPPPPRPRWHFPLFAVTLFIFLVLGALGMCRPSILRSPLLGDREGQTTGSHDLVVQKVRSVAQLLTSETTVRDVVVYENTWMNSTKRSLVVVTGRVLAG